MKTIAIILAAGLGTRMGSDKPKQFLEIGDKPIVIHSLEVFQKHPEIDEIILVINPDFEKEFDELFDKYIFSKLSSITLGGKERSDSSKNALKLVSNSEISKVLLHDAVRPFIDASIISNVIVSLDTYDAVCVSIPSTDTVMISNENNEVVDIPDRGTIYLGQTPQGFKSNVIKEAYRKAVLDKDFIATDDCGVVKKYLPQTIIKLVEGSIENKKITFPQDL